MQLQEKSKTIITLRRVWTDYQKIRDLKPATLKNYNQRLNVYLRDWLDIPINEITKDMVEERHSSISGKAIANSAFRTLRALLAYAEAKYVDEKGEPIIKHNPVKRLTEVRGWHRDRRRKTVLQISELNRWFRAVFSLDNSTTRDVLLLLLFTGMRRNEAIELKWKDVDLNAGIIKLHNTKNGDDFDVPMSDYVWRLMHARSLTASSEFVFPGSSRGHTAAAYTSCSIARRRSGLQFSLHDLRRTFMTVADEIEIKNEVIKQLVNHKVDDVTEGYIVRSLERRRRATQRITNAILKYAGLKTLEETRNSAPVVPQVRVEENPQPIEIKAPRLNGREKLTDQQVREIRELSLSGVKGAFIAERYGISPDYLTDLLKMRYRKSASQDPAPTDKPDKPRALILRDVSAERRKAFEAQVLDICRKQQIQPFTITRIMTQHDGECSYIMVQEALKSLAEQGSLNRIGVNLYRVPTNER